MYYLVAYTAFSICIEIGGESGARSHCHQLNRLPHIPLMLSPLCLVRRLGHDPRTYLLKANCSNQLELAAYYLAHQTELESVIHNLEGCCFILLSYWCSIWQLQRVTIPQSRRRRFLKTLCIPVPPRSHKELLCSSSECGCSGNRLTTVFYSCLSLYQ